MLKVKAQAGKVSFLCKYNKSEGYTTLTVGTLLLKEG